MILLERDIEIAGLLVSPFAADAVGALVVFLLLRALSRRLGLRRVFANPPLAEAAILVCLMGVAVVFF